MSKFVPDNFNPPNKIHLGILCDKKADKKAWPCKPHNNNPLRNRNDVRSVLFSVSQMVVTEPSHTLPVFVVD